MLKKNLFICLFLSLSGLQLQTVSIATTILNSLFVRLPFLYAQNSLSKGCSQLLFNTTNTLIEKNTDIATSGYKNFGLQNLTVGIVLSLAINKGDKIGTSLMVMDSLKPSLWNFIVPGYSMLKTQSLTGEIQNHIKKQVEPTKEETDSLKKAVKYRNFATKELLQTLIFNIACFSLQSGLESVTNIFAGTKINF